MLTLLWLTVSTPFIMSTQENLAKQQKTLMAELPVGDSSDDCSDNANNNIEEKVPNSSNSLSEEFLHDQHAEDYSDVKTSQNHILENSTTYIAFHGELHAPPPNVA
ncbi:hypothetical protein [Ferruginibacter sp.]